MKHWKLSLSIIIIILASSLLYFMTGNLEKDEITMTLADDFIYEDFSPAEELTLTNRLVADNNRFEFHINELTTHITIIDKISGEVWRSNPAIEDTNPIVTPASLNRHKATLEITYANEAGAFTTINNYKYSILHDQPLANTSWPVNDIRSFEMKDITDGVQIYYTFKDISIDYLYFPKFMTRDMMALLKETLSAYDFAIIEATYKNINTDFDVYEIGSYEDLSNNIIRRLYPIFYDIDPNDELDTSLGYTRARAISENQSYGYMDIIEKPVFKVGVELQLTNNGLRASILKNSIVEPENFRISNISLFPLFGTAVSVQNGIPTEGYIVIPDGSGAVIKFNNGKSYQSQYKKKLYGEDLALLPYKMPEQQQKISMPVYGMVKENGGYAAIITEGDGMAFINADVSGRVDSYNKAFPSFDIRKSERVTIGSGFQKYELDVWTKPVVDTDFTVEYHFLSGTDNSYVGIAHVFQNYLIDLGLTRKDQTTETVLNTELIGAYDTKEFFLGIPYQSMQSLTTFNQAKLIIDELYDEDISNINLLFTGIMSGGLNPGLQDNSSFESILGSRKEYDQLVSDLNQKSITLYPMINFTTTASYNRLFQNFNYTSQRVSGDMSYDFVYHFPSGLPYEEFNSTVEFTAVNKSPYVINPQYYMSLYDKMAKSNNLDAIAFNKLGASLAGSYDRNHPVYKQDAIAYQTAVLAKVEADLHLENPLYFAMPFADSISNLPIESTLYSIIDYSIPLMQLVLSGFVDYSGGAINVSADRNPQYLFLKAIETGSNLKYTLSYDSTIELLNSPYNYYMSTHYVQWMDTIVAQVQTMNQLGIHQGHLINHERKQSNVYQVDYSNGLSVLINYNAYAVTVSGITISGMNYAVID